MEEERKIPLHVSIIMDGNGRWAKERGKERTFGHLEGVNSVRACVEAAGEEGVKYLSLFAFSEENWNRPESEILCLMDLMVKSIENEYKSLMENKVRFIVLGNRARLSDSLNASIDSLMKATENNDGLTLIVFLSYSGKWDILQAAKKLATKALDDPSIIDQIDEAGFSGLLATDGIPDPDLIIRTSGEQRISNYLLWQSAYSEFYFPQVLWPDFRKDEFREALRVYASRDRRYGKVK